MLSVENLHCWYDRSHVLQGVSLEVKAGEIVTLMGRNGAGKTTTLRGVMGLVQKRSGRVMLDGTDITQAAVHRRVHLGIAFVPEHRQIVPGMSVADNLRLALIAAKADRPEEQAFDYVGELFPRLRDRWSQRADSMSGGEQQMLAIARAIIVRPRLLIMDEPSEGIMPALVDEIFAFVAGLHETGVAVLLVEQNVRRALEISQRAYIMDQGIIVHTDRASAVLADSEVQRRYCAI